MQNPDRNIGSVTEWFDGLRSKDPQAQSEIWNRFVSRLIGFADSRLKGRSCPLIDAEDVASMAFYNFFDKSWEEFESMVNRSDLWQVLTLLAERRIIDEYRKTRAQKNGGRHLLINESVIGVRNGHEALGLDGLAGSNTKPDIEVILIEELNERLNSLDDDVLRRIAIEKLQGYRNTEIANKLATSLRSVERKLQVIRELFQSAMWQN